ncbi:hypothetical protein ACFRCI_47500 [Streptomyces sp. NPDC056638]|uniref:hypothetical protein n=1 Tax=Streptomyces sp. NPDC056638 TaxID=3345887 RepID=UPI0036970503
MSPSNIRGVGRRRSKEEIQRAREAVIANRDSVVLRYTDGESLAALSREYDVNPDWLGKQFNAWNVPRRDRSAAAVVRGPGVSPYAV